MGTLLIEPSIPELLTWDAESLSVVDERMQQADRTTRVPNGLFEEVHFLVFAFISEGVRFRLTKKKHRIKSWLPTHNTLPLYQLGHIYTEFDLL